MSEMRKVIVLSGDGIGPEVCEQAIRVLELIQEQPEVNFEIEEALMGGIAIDSGDSALPASTLAKAKAADAVLLGAVGGPQYDHLEANKRPEKGLLELRAGLEVFANYRPVHFYPGLNKHPNLPSQNEAIHIFRELTGGIYFGEPRGITGEGTDREAYNTMRYSYQEIARIARLALGIADSKNQNLCSVDKANVLEVSRLWREVVTEIAAKEYPDVSLSHMYVDNAAMQLVSNPRQFDVILTSNMFGDILSDLASELTGSIGMQGSASFSDKKTALYEPIHGTAPDIAGADKANPCGTILSTSFLIQYSLNHTNLGNEVNEAIEAVVEQGYRTADIAKKGEKVIGCNEMGDAIVAELKQRLLKLRA